MNGLVGAVSYAGKMAIRLLGRIGGELFQRTETRLITTAISYTCIARGQRSGQRRKEIRYCGDARHAILTGCTALD